MNYPASVVERSRPAKLMAAPKAVTSRVRAVRTSERADKSSAASSRNFLERLPSEILIKILSYLDASALFTLNHVSKLLYRLTNDNALWKKIYVAEFARNGKLPPPPPARTDEPPPGMTAAEARGRAAGYWKRLCFRTAAARDANGWRRRLGSVSRHTGLPGRTERVLRNLNVTWELTVTDESGREDALELSWSRFCETSVTLCWSGGGCLPSYQQISTLQLHGVRRIGLNCPGLKKPGLRSLMAKLDVQTLTKSARVIGRDGLVELKLLQPGIVIGVWKDQRSVAFVMFTLHLRGLTERSVQGSPVCPYVEPVVKPPFDDIDPEYGLHGYRLHIVLHNTVCEIMSGSFSQLFCRRTQIQEGFIQLTAISGADVSQRTPLSGDITLPWRCEALQGAVQNCCILSLTLLDEFRKPFWCASSPVSMTPEKTSVSYDYDGEHFLIHYEDSDGQVKMQLARMEEQKFFLVNLIVYVTVGKVNEHFGREY